MDLSSDPTSILNSGTPSSY